MEVPRDAVANRASNYHSRGRRHYQRDEAARTSRALTIQSEDDDASKENRRRSNGASDDGIRVHRHGRITVMRPAQPALSPEGELRVEPA